jgi:hypothetical protein
MRRDTFAADNDGMQPPESRVIVVRAWRDAGGVRVRLLADADADGDYERQWIVGSIAEACAVLGSLLAELLGTPARADATGWPPIPPSTPD